jgi:hypothetical protein
MGANRRSRFDWLCGCSVIRLKKYTLLALSLAVFTLAGTAVSDLLGQERPTNRVQLSIHEIQAEAVLGFPVERPVSVDLGDLPTDRDVTVTLRIMNQSGAKIDYDEVQVSCACIQAQLEHVVIDQGKSGICRLTIDTSSKQRARIVNMPIKLFNSNSPDSYSIINLKGYLEGYLGFLDPFMTADLKRDQEFNEVSIPFAATAPVSGDKIEIIQRPAAGTYHIEPSDRENDLWNLRLSIKTSTVPPEGMAIGITIADPVLDRKSECTVMLRHDRGIVINPRTLRLTQNDDVFTGNCIMTIRDADRTAGDDNRTGVETGATTAAGVPLVSATMNGESVRLTLRRMSDEHFRLSLTVSSEAIERMQAQQDSVDARGITWSVSTKSGSRQVFTPVSVVRSQQYALD